MSASSISLVLPIGARTARVEVETSSPSIAIVGPSGIGKTTLLRALAGLIDGARGRVVLAGEVLEDGARNIRQRPRERRLGWVPQDARLFPHLSVRDNVAFGARGPVEALVDALEIRSLLDRSPETLSGGERQRVAIARALSSRPRALLLDEPLVALDRPARADVARAIVEHCAREDIVRIVVSHDESDLMALATERFVMGTDGIAPDAQPQR